jgi:predicted Zn finger-like uncharacterized protein
MPIRFRCESCESRIKVPDGAEGRRVRCPRCGHLQRVPRVVAAATELQETESDGSAETAAGSESIESASSVAPAFEPAPPEAGVADRDTGEGEPEAEREGPGREIGSPAAVSAGPDQEAQPTPPADKPDSEAGHDEIVDSVPGDAGEVEDVEDPDAHSVDDVDEHGDDDVDRFEDDDLSLEAPDERDRGDEVNPSDTRSLFDHTPTEGDEGRRAAREVLGRASGDAGRPARGGASASGGAYEGGDEGERPSDLVSSVPPIPPPQPRRPTPAPAIPLSGRAAPARTGEKATGSGEDAGPPPEETARPPFRLAPRDPSVPIPSSRPRHESARGVSPLDVLPWVLRVLALLLALAGLIHVVRQLNAGAEAMILFNAIVVWLTAATVTWTVGEIAAAVARMTRR